VDETIVCVSGASKVERRIEPFPPWPPT